MANREHGCQPHWALSSGSHKQCVRNPACPRFYQYLVLPDFNFHPSSAVQLTVERASPWSLRHGAAVHFLTDASSPVNFRGFPVLSGHCSLTVLSEFFCKPHVENPATHLPACESTARFLFLYALCFLMTTFEKSLCSYSLIVFSYFSPSKLLEIFFRCLCGLYVCVCMSMCVFTCISVGTACIACTNLGVDL